MSALRIKGALLVLCGLLLAAALGPAPAQANRALLSKEALAIPEGQEPPEDACGAAVSEGTLFVSDYYHGAVKGWKLAAGFPFAPGGPSFGAGSSPEGPCEIAADSKGALYANLWHQSVVRLAPSSQVFDEGSSTGVAVDEKDNVYVNDRTRVVVYDSSGTQIEEIGAAGALKDAYGLAVFGGRVYVPDAFDDEIKVFEPEIDSLNPVASISGTPQHSFFSLTDADVTVDPTNGHLLVLDNLQAGFEFPEAAIDEFSAAGEFLGQLKARVIDGEPSGLAVDPFGRLFATSGNSEGANVFAFGPYTESGPEGVGGEEAPEAPGSAQGTGVGVAEAAIAAPPSSEPRVEPKSRRKAHKRQRRLRKGQRGALRQKLAPLSLPR